MPHGAHSTRGMWAAAAGFTPIRLSGCVLWLRADLGVTDSSGVTGWNDQSGNGNHATQAGASTKCPTYSTSSGPGSRPGITFDGTSDYLEVNGIASYFGTDLPFTIVASFKKTATAAAPILMVGDSATIAPRMTSYCPVSGTQVRLDRVDDAAVTANRSYTTTISDDTWRSIQHFSSGTQVNYRNNATTGTQVAQDVGTATPNIATIGAMRHVSYVNGTEFWAGTLWELIVYSRELNSTERDQIYSYQLAMGAAA